LAGSSLTVGSSSTAGRSLCLWMFASPAPYDFEPSRLANELTKD
jgi:hypothetical protein